MAHSERFEITVPSEIAAFIHMQVEQGTHRSDSELVCEAVRAMKQRAEKTAALRDMVQASLADPRPSLTDAEVAEHFRQRAKSSGAPGTHA